MSSSVDLDITASALMLGIWRWTFDRLLVSTDLTECDGTGPVPVGLLYSSGGGCGLSSSFGGNWTCHQRGAKKRR